MMLDFVCQGCGTTYHAAESHIGKMIRCRQCGELVPVTEPARQLTKNGHCDKPMDSSEAHGFCGGPARQERGSNLRSRWFPAGGAPSSKRHLALLLASVLIVVMIGFVLKEFNIFHPVEIRSNADEESNRTSSAASLSPTADSQPSSPTVNTACGVNDSGASSSLHNGTEILKRRRVSGKGTLEVENGNSTDAAVNLVDTKTNKIVRRFYVEANNRFTASGIAPGIYQVYFETGHDWNSETRKFNRCAETRRFLNDFEYSESEDEATGTTHFIGGYITLHKVVGGTAHTVPIDQRIFDEMMAQSE
jgi:hypothetical protein